MEYRAGEGVFVRDKQSRNGTYVNNRKLFGEHRVRVGDKIVLGEGGPELIVEKITLPPVPEAPPVAAASPVEAAPEAPAPAPAPAPAAAKAPPAPEPAGAARRSFGGVGRTVFVKQAIHEATKRSSDKVRWVVYGALVVVVAAVGAAYWYSEQRMRATLEETTQAIAQQQALTDSVVAEAQADRERLRQDLESARASSAPTEVLDSLRLALNEATSRTQNLERSLRRANSELSSQLASVDSLRAQRESEVARLQTELRAASGSGVSASLLDSLRRAIETAETRARELSDQRRAVEGVNLASVAQRNQAAVGLLSVYRGGNMYSGTGFVVSSEGYFITNRHVLWPDGSADSIYVTMADQRTPMRARVVVVADPRGPDLAVGHIPGYRGPHIIDIDWSGRNVSQGEAAALIGFPAGRTTALDLSATVRTSMSAGIFSKVTAESIQFDGFTIGGSSGSPIFNGSGEVVAVHRAGLRDAAGLAFAVPIPLAIPLLPDAVKTELGISGP